MANVVPETGFVRTTFLRDSTEKSILAASDFLNSDFMDKELFQSSLIFIDQCIFQASPSTFESMEKLGVFPWNEAEIELQQSLTLAYLGQFKSSVDSLRRALEIVIVAIYFSDDSIPKKATKAWLKSEANTPFFSNSLDTIFSRHRFAMLNQELKWKDRTKQFYWKLSNVSHTKGIENSLLKIQPTSLVANGIPAPSFSAAAFNKFSSLFIACIQEIAVYLSCLNPIILVPLPLFEKFGLNPPLSGFFEEAETDSFRRVLPPEYLNFAERCFLSDPDIIAVKDEICNMRDLSDDEIKLQCEDHEELMRMLK